MSVHDPWCPNCGDEFQPHIAVCPDCGFRLQPGPRPETADPPAASSWRTADLVAIDLSGLDPSARRTLSLMLDAERIGHRLDGAVPSIPTPPNPG